MPGLLVAIFLVGHNFIDPEPVQAGFFGRDNDKTRSRNNDWNSQNIGLTAGLGLVGNATGGIDALSVHDGALVPDAALGSLAVEIPVTTEISIYVVRAGDTLSQIAEMYNVSVNTIVWANDLKSSRDIYEGQTLVILPISGVKHTVAKDETLSGIAKKYKADQDEIINFNGLADGAKLAEGDVLIIPDGEIATPSVRAVAGSSRQPVYAGYYLRPIQGGVRTRGLHGFNGVDLATYQGAPIYAAADGVVLVSKTGGWNGGYGNYLVIKHSNGTQTLYAHNASNAVSVGQFVVQGQVIGYVGSTGRSTGPHVHFEVRGAANPF